MHCASKPFGCPGPTAKGGTGRDASGTTPQMPATNHLNKVRVSIVFVLVEPEVASGAGQRRNTPSLFLSLCSFV
jgi:hypothetical protein